MQSFFGKYPEINAPVSIGKIIDDSSRYELSKRYDNKHGTSLLKTKIIPLTRQQFNAAYYYARKK
jgi:hypothetical protein